MQVLLDIFLDGLPSDLDYIRPIAVTLIIAFAVGTSFELVPTMLISLFGGRTRR